MVIVLRFDQGDGNIGFVIEDIVRALRFAASNQLSTDDDSAFRETDLLTYLQHLVPDRAINLRRNEFAAYVALTEELFFFEVQSGECFSEDYLNYSHSCVLPIDLLRRTLDLSLRLSRFLNEVIAAEFNFRESVLVNGCRPLPCEIQSHPASRRARRGP